VVQNSFEIDNFVVDNYNHYFDNCCHNLMDSLSLNIVVQNSLNNLVIFHCFFECFVGL
jgi:hypothetical protein